MNVISASRRTDIPAWYGDWFRRRLNAGQASYRNPFGGQIHTVSLRPEDVIAFVFWTRWTEPFLPVLETLLERGYQVYFQHTLTGYGPPLEPNVPPLGKAVESMIRLSRRLRPELVRWRYDPIVLSGERDHAFHLRHFEALCRRLEGTTKQCHTSFVQFYRKVRRNLDKLEREKGEAIFEARTEERLTLAAAMSRVAAQHGIRLVSCCDPLLHEAGIPEGRCVDAELIESVRPDLPGLRLPRKPLRPGCGCAASRDIGAYNSCLGGCRYCYATESPQAAAAHHARHDPQSEIL